MAKHVSIVLLVMAAMIGGSVFFTWINYTNQEVRLRAEVEAQKETVNANFDKMWKVIKQQCQVSDKYKDGFKEIYIGIMEGRYSKGNAPLMNWVKEANPQFDSSLYSKLMVSIEANRTEFFYEQKKLISLAKEHEVLITTIPGRWFLPNAKKVEYTIITSKVSQDAAKTGQENDIDLNSK